MTEAPPYYGPVEALTVELAAARCHCSLDHFLTLYDGPRVDIGEGARRVVRIPAWALHEWLAQRAFVPGSKPGASSWDDVGDGKKDKGKRQGVRSRQRGEAA